MVGADRLVSPQLVGRRAEVRWLGRAAEAAARRSGQCVLIAGEAGIGKTRLVAEVRAGFPGRILVLQCYEEDVSFPLAPLQLCLRRLHEVADATEAELLRRRADILAPLLPQMTGWTAPRLAAGDEEDPATRQRSLFEAVAGLLFDLAAERPLLVIVEDLHWSDESTLAFIRFLARRLDGRAVLLLGTYRPSAVPAPLADLLVGLQREHLAQMITLGPLTRDELYELLRRLFDSAAPITLDLRDSVTAFSEGNPFYVEELVRVMIQTGDIYQVDGVWARKAIGELRVPDSVQDAVRRRSEVLDEAAHRVLTLAAVAGRRFDFETLAGVSGLAEPELVAILRQLIAARFIIEERPDAFAFCHPLLREAVRAQLLARERRAFHAQVAAALERLHGYEVEAYAPELAYHYYEAGAWEQALPHARRAGEQARRLDATREALTQFTRALDCLERLGAPPLLDLLLARAELNEQTGDFSAAESDLTSALEGAQQTGHLREAWQASLKLGYLWAARDYGRSLAWFERALLLSDELVDPLARAETLNRIGNVHLNRDEPDQALPYHQAALAAFETAGDLVGQANTLELMAVSHYSVPDVMAGVACAERALLLAREVAARAKGANATAIHARGARSVVFHASIHLLLPLRFETEVGPPVEPQRLIDTAEEALRLARVLEWPGAEAQALGLLGGFYGLLGQYDRGLTYLRDSLRLAQQLDHAAGVSASQRMIASVLLDLLAFDEAAERLRQARVLAVGAGAHMFAYVAALALAQTLATRGRPEDLAEANDLLADLLSREGAPGGRIKREALCVRAELELAQRNATAALATLESLIATTRHLPDHGVKAVPRLALLLGRALAAAGRAGEAAGALEAARAGAAAQGRRPLLWRAHTALGRVRLDMRQRRAAQHEYGHARVLIAELGASVPDTALREAFMREAFATIPAPPTPSSRLLVRQAHHGLTERERTVAALVAQGCSNREIADTLVISERTAERHVANILAKLGLASRVQLAAWVAEHLPSA